MLFINSQKTSSPTANTHLEIEMVTLTNKSIPSSKSTTTHAFEIQTPNKTDNTSKVSFFTALLNRILNLFKQKYIANGLATARLFTHQDLPQVLDFLVEEVSKKEKPGLSQALKADYQRSGYKINDVSLTPDQKLSALQAFLTQLNPHSDQAQIVEQCLTQSLTMGVGVGAHGVNCNGLEANTTYHLSKKDDGTVVITAKWDYRDLKQLMQFRNESGGKDITQKVKHKNVDAKYSVTVEVQPDATLTRSPEAQSTQSEMSSVQYSGIRMNGSFNTYQRQL